MTLSEFSILEKLTSPTATVAQVFGVDPDAPLRPPDATEKAEPVTPTSQRRAPGRPRECRLSAVVPEESPRCSRRPHYSAPPRSPDSPVWRCIARIRTPPSRRDHARSLAHRAGRLGSHPRRRAEHHRTACLARTAVSTYHNRATPPHPTQSDSRHNTDRHIHLTLSAPLVLMLDRDAARCRKAANCAGETAISGSVISPALTSRYRLRMNDFRPGRRPKVVSTHRARSTMKSA